ncbi:MAG TPA: ATP-binding protein, partial [Nitriliruptorales bacterium]
QVLAHVRLELELLAREGGADGGDLERLARVTGRAQNDLRDVINGLRAGIEDAGLAGSLRAYVADLRSRSGPIVHFSAHTSHAHPPEIEREVFRIAQEAISNAVQHADARTITVHLESDDAGIALTVDDDGRGLPSEPPTSGMGLTHMRERAERLGARLDLISTGPGTGVRLRVPASAAWERPDVNGGAGA